MSHVTITETTYGLEGVEPTVVTTGSVTTSTETSTYPLPGSHGKIVNILPLLNNRITGVVGDVAEFGCFEGGTIIRMAKITKRRAWAFDTFQGIPAEEWIPGLDNADPPGKWKPTNDPVDTFAHCGHDVRPVVGRFEETLLTFHYNILFSLVHLDCDNYHAYRTVLRWLYPFRMSPGGLIVIDDYHACEGCRKAVDEFFVNTGLHFEPNSYTIQL